MNEITHRTEAELLVLFEQAARAISFYETQRNQVLTALRNLRLSA